MSIWKCSNCGNEIPVNSKFCNHCGAQIAQSITCPGCGHSAPVGSKFCPECGEPFVIPTPKITFPANDAHDNDSLGWDFNDDEAENAAPTPALPEIVPPAPQDDADAQIDEPAPKRRRSFGHIWAAVFTIIILAVAAYIYLAATDTIRSRHAVTEIEEELEITPDEAAQILRNTLGSEALNDVAFARQVDPSPEGLYQIAGFTCFTTPSGNSQLTAYTLERDSLEHKWAVSRHATRKAQHYILCTDYSVIFGKDKSAPVRVTSIPGKDYLFFAYALLPKKVGSGDASVILALYNVNTADIISIDFAGKAIDRDGKTVVMCQPINQRHSPEAELLMQIAQDAELIYQPSEAEMAEQNAADAINLWLQRNRQTIEAVGNGAIDVHLNIDTFDNPLFTAEADYLRIENAKMIVVANNRGAVLGYSKTKKRYFVIYAPRSEQPRASVRFADNETVIVETDELNFSFNPHNITASAINSFFE
ncbi:MAG: zinc-ribbon domain-containing protein [Muribaculaceae bacterium]